MINHTGTKQNLLELESSRTELIEKTLQSPATCIKIFLYKDYFDKVLSSGNPNLSEAFLTEFIEDYLDCIIKFEVWGVEPNLSKEIILHIEKLGHLNLFTDYAPTLNAEVSRIKKQFEKLKLILAGVRTDDIPENKAFFPLIDPQSQSGLYGIIESATIKIQRSTKEDKFIIVPSEKDIEKNILQQCKTSWQIAIRLLSRYKRKPHQFHEVVISFDKKEGFYYGCSLGIALTIGFIQELLKFYNASFTVKIKNNIATTGSVDENEKIKPLGKKIIDEKVEIIFYSQMQMFVVPKDDEAEAKVKIEELQKDYPNKEIEIVGVENINDLLDRRSLVDIRKQNPVVRTAKYAGKNWVAVVFALILINVLGYFYLREFDDNPAMLEFHNDKLLVKNKNGRIVWSVEAKFDSLIVNNYRYQNGLAKIVDIEGDGQNELLINGNFITDQKFRELLMCYQNKDSVIWSHKFTELVESNREKLDSHYCALIIDTVMFNGNNSLVIRSNNYNSFSSAIYMLDLKTGKRVSDILWSSGHLIDAMLKDIDGDGIKDLIVGGLDNGYERPMLFGVRLDKLKGYRPTTEPYRIHNKNLADLIFCIMIPKTDYNIYLQKRFNEFTSGIEDIPNEKVITFNTSEEAIGGGNDLYYKMSYNLRDFNIIVVNNFRVRRDTLVARGILKPPYTDTKEYTDLLKSQILYWNSEKFVKREELK